MFTRSITSSDLIDTSGGAPKDSLDYSKIEKSTFVDKILYKSSGILNARVDLGHDQNPESSSSSKKSFNPNKDFSEDFQANGSYTIIKMYCKQRNKRSFSFVHLSRPFVQKKNIRAVVNKGK